MYNYGTAAEVLDTVFDVIEGGKTVEAAKVTEVIADNGAKLFDVATSEVYAANGSASAVDSVVSIAESAASGTSAGAGILAVDVGVAGAAIAPALGIGIGYVTGNALYNANPSFWSNVSDQLESAGQTIKGKVNALLMPDGSTAFSRDTIEIFKNSFIDAGAYDNNYVEHQSGESITRPFETGGSGVAGAIAAMNTSAVNCKGLNKLTQEQVEHAQQYGKTNIPNMSEFQQLGYWLFFTGWSYVSAQAGNGASILGVRINGTGANITTQISTDNTHGDGRLTINFSNSVNVSITEYCISRNPNPYPSAATTSTYNNVTSVTYAFKWWIFDAWTIGTDYTTNTLEGATLPNATDPFPTTYPNWTPFEFPSTLPVEMPDYYPVSMPTPDATQDPSQAGANETETQLNKLIELLFQNLPENNPEITPDPDPVPEPETDPVPDPTPPEPEPNPPDPNPPVPDPIPTIPIPTLNTTRADRMFTVYNPTDTNVNSLGAFLWTSNVIEQIKKLWDDPMQAIISFHKIYGAPTVGSSQEIVLGYIESGVSAPVVTSQFCDVDCGSVTVPELLNNATSYAPFTSLHIYLPFIGIMELDTNECMKATLHVKYRIDVYTGTCIALIYVSRNPDLTHEQVLYTFSGNASQQLPLTSSSFGGAISALLGLAGAGVAVASGGALGVAAGAVSAAHSLTQEMVHINRSGGLSANAGILGSRTPYLILSRQYCSDANGYAGFYGYPSNKTVYIGNCNGYIKCKDVIFRGSCTQAEAEEIESLLKSGVYV